MVTRGYKELQAVTGGYKGLEGVAKPYIGLQSFKLGYRVEAVTRG